MNENIGVKSKRNIEIYDIWIIKIEKKFKILWVQKKEIPVCIENQKKINYYMEDGEVELDEWYKLWNYVN